VSPLAEQVAEPTATPTDEAERAERRRRALALGAAQLAPAPELTSFWQELRFRDLVQRTAAEVGANPAIVTVLLGVEADTEGAPKGVLTDLGPFRQDTLQEGDDPSDQDTLIRRAAEHIRALQERWSLLELVAAAYFGALDERGQVTEASAGQLSGQDYVQRVRAAHKRHLEGQGMLPQWLVSPFGDLPLSSRMIKFGYLSDYGEELAFEIRGEEGVARYSTIHLGLDLQVPGRPEGGRGTPIVAPFAGRILRTADPVGGPFGIWLENRALDLRARLMHMDGLVVGIETGVQVRAGQQLGILGEQGTEGFPHLHLALERISDGARINPALFYRVRDPSDPATATARWPVDLQSAWTQAADFRWFNTRLVPYDRPTTAQVSRSVPLEVPTQ
jgi:murein DD-endopeptidase MepM/ murein hydrolase activator NlpD